MYGTERLIETFQAALGADLDTSVQSIIADVHKFRGDALVKDDQTLIAVELVAGG